MTFKEQLRLMREQQRREQAWSARQAQRQMDFQERMSSTAHQREMEDLRNAGLNPVLTATGGSGASSPSGAMADGSEIASMIPQMLAVASDTVKAVRTSAKAAENAADSANTANETASDVIPVIANSGKQENDWSHFDNPVLQTFYDEYKDEDLPGIGNIGKAMRVGNSMYNNGGKEIIDSVMSAVNTIGSNNEINDSDREIARKYGRDERIDMTKKPDGTIVFYNKDNHRIELSPVKAHAGYLAAKVKYNSAKKTYNFTYNPYKKYKVKN